MLFVIVLGVILLIAFGFLIIPGFNIDVSCEYIYKADGETKREFYEVQFPDEETKSKVALELKAKYIKENGLSAKPEDIKDVRIRYWEVPCKTVVKRRLEWVCLPDLDDLPGFLSIIGFVIVGVGALVCGGFAIGAHCDAAKQHTRVHLERVVNELELRQQTLLNTLNGVMEDNVEATPDAYVVYDMGSISQAINSYNYEVLDFKEDLYRTKLLSENPWTNWYVCPVFKEVKGYNSGATNYKDILGDNLKVFEPKEKI